MNKFESIRQYRKAVLNNPIVTSLVKLPDISRSDYGIKAYENIAPADVKSGMVTGLHKYFNEF